MSATLTQVREDLALRCDAIPGLIIYPTIPDSIESPALVVGMPERITYTLTFAMTGLTWRIPLRLYAARWDAEVAQGVLDEYLAQEGTASIRRAIEEGTSTLSSDWHGVQVIEARDFGAYRVGDVEYLGCEIIVEVVTL